MKLHTSFRGKTQLAGNRSPGWYFLTKIIYVIFRWTDPGYVSEKINYKKSICKQSFSSDFLLQIISVKIKLMINYKNLKSSWDVILGQYNKTFPLNYNCSFVFLTMDDRKEIHFWRYTSLVAQPLFKWTFMMEIKNLSSLLILMACSVLHFANSLVLTVCTKFEL